MDTAAALRYYERYKKIKSYKDAYGRVKAVWDDDTRAGAVFNELLNFSIKAAGDLIGENLSKHPYFAFHKAHLEILTKALNASSVSDSAEADWTRAAATAVQTSEVANRCQSYRVRRDGLNLTWSWISESLRILRNYGKDPVKGKADLDLTGATADHLRTNTDADLQIYRGRWCELAGDALSLMLMTYSQYRTTEMAIESYRAKVEKLKKGNIFDRLFGQSQDEKEQWRQFDAETATGPDRKVKEAQGDPVGVAQRAYSTIDQLSYQISFCADLIMSDEPYNRPEGILDQFKRSR